MLGLGTTENPYQVVTPEDLNDVRNNLTAYYKQMNDIDLSGYSNWIPIGDYYNRFAGGYNGGNFEISNLTLIIMDDGVGDAKLEQRNKGLFGIVETEGNIENIKLTNATIDYDTDNILRSYGSYFIGGLIGNTFDVKLINCHVSITVNISIQSSDLNAVKKSPSAMGGLVGEYSVSNGFPTSSYVDSCSCDCTWNVIGDYSSIQNCGCLFGEAWGTSAIDSLIVNCHATGNIIGRSYLGIFMGYGDDLTFNKCSAQGSIKTNNGYVSGFGGQVTRSIFTDCYSIVNIESTADYTVRNPDVISGFAGDVDEVSCSNCYAVLTYTNNSGLPFYIYGDDPPSHSAFMGAYYAYNEWSTNSLQNCFYDATLSPFTDEKALGRTTMEMKTQETYIGWDFTNIWAISADKNNGYPNFDITNNIIIYTKSFYL